MDTPENTQYSPQAEESLSFEIAAAAQANSNAPLKQEEEKEQEQKEDEKPEEAAATSATIDTVPEAQSVTPTPEQLDENGFSRPRPVSDYLKEDNSLPGWVWTLSGVALIGGLDALDDNDSDSDGGSNSTPTNTAPQFSSETLTLDSVAEDGSRTFTLDVDDADGDTLNFSGSNPTNGTVVQGDQDNQFTYTPDDNFFGDDSFIIAVSDGSGGTDSITISITVTPINDAPQVDTSQELGTKTGIALAFDVDATDIEEDTLFYSVAEGDNAPKHGTVDAVNASGDFTYTPNAGFFGEDSFQIIVSDGDKESTQNITVNVRGTQTITADNVSINEGAESTTAMVFILNIENAAAEDIVLNVSKSGGSANADADYTELADTVTLMAGQTSVEYVVNVIGDAVNEVNETLQLTFDSLQLAAPLTVTGTIINDDSTTLTLSANDDSGVADNDGITQAQTVTLIITGATGADVEIFSGEQSLGTATEDTENLGTYTFLTSELDEGSYVFTAKASQDGSEISSSLPLSVTIDLSNPTLTEFSAKADDDTVTLIFSEAVDFLDATGITFTHDDDSIAAVLDSLDGNTAVFSFDTDIVSGSLIDVAIADNSVNDLAGNLLAGIEFAGDPNAITV